MVKNKAGVRSSKGGELSGLAWPAAALGEVSPWDLVDELLGSSAPVLP